ncbi:MAG: hypothetical protein QOD07_1809 [Frankiaceae bacterium]|nr:hypothetical protein [Frankiaceae bacterium]
MTILGSGDLAPRRRGRRRRTKTPYVVAVLVLAAAAAGGWFGWRAWHGGKSGAPARPLAVCATPSSSPSPAAAKTVKVAVLNGTARVGLAHTVAGQLTLRGFAVVKVGNGPSTTGPPRVVYAPGETGLALTLAEQVAGAQIEELSTQTPGTVQLDISSGFRRLATPAEAAAAKARDLGLAAPSPAVCTTPRG